MYDDFLNTTGPGNTPENNDQTGHEPETEAKDSGVDTSETRESVSSPEESAPYQEELYSDSSSYRQPDSSGYSNPYTAAGHYRTDEPSGGQSEPYRQPAQRPAYDDGYYHRSFSGDTSGNGVNYTYPQSAQPVQSAPTPPQPPQRRKEKKSSGISKGGIALLLIICILISGAAGFGGSLLAQKINSSKYDSTSADTMVIHKVNTEAQVAGTENLVDKSTDQITSEVADTVVEITTEVMQTNSFYGQYIAQGAGSGVIISEDGYIVTNNHVIEDASSIKVTTRGGDSYDATLIGADSEVDIAIIKIDAKDLPAAVFGDSSTLEVGDKAVIIGNPLGTLGGSVTEGIVSALDRSIVIDGKTMHLMQTDAAINPGNSGGGMFNGQGELAGIVVAKSSSEEIDNIGFVIPINNVLDILGDLKDYGYVRGRADTGMSFIDLSNQMYAWYYYGNSEAGVYISSVESGSNAAEAGFRAGDRVISVDGQQISSADEITEIIKKKSVGDTISFELERSGSKGTLDLTLEEYVPTTTKSSDSSSNSGNNGGNNGGGNGGNPFGGFGW